MLFSHFLTLDFLLNYLRLTFANASANTISAVQSYIFEWTIPTTSRENYTKVSVTSTRTIMKNATRAPGAAEEIVLVGPTKRLYMPTCNLRALEMNCHFRKIAKCTLYSKNFGVETWLALKFCQLLLNSEANRLLVVRSRPNE